MVGGSIGTNIMPVLDVDASAFLCGLPPGLGGFPAWHVKLNILFAHPVHHGAMIYMSFLQERSKLSLGVSIQID